MAGTPNILIIMTDELRNDLVLHNWYPEVKTPTIDGLRRNGTTFTNAFCQTPTCVPSRGSFVTGKYPHQLGLYDHGCMIPDAEPTMGHHFANHGYESIAFGKTHSMCPGFESVTYDVSASMGSENHGYRVTDADATGVFDSDIEEYCDFVAVNQFRDFLEHRDRARPFLAFLGIYAPHPPLYPPAQYAGIYAGLPVEIPLPIPGEDDTKPERHSIPRDRWRSLSRDTHERIHRVELGMITMIDDLLGRTLAALNRAGVADDTVVVFTSDHGDQMGEHEMLGKFHNVYDGSMRVPLILRGPGVGDSEIDEELVGLIDVYPTLCELAGIELPSAEHELAGRSLLSYDGDRDAVYCQFRDAFVIRTADWKLVIDPHDRSELYDLVNDPNEAVNRYGDPIARETQLDLTTRLVEHLATHRRGEITRGRNGFFG